MSQPSFSVMPPQKPLTLIVATTSRLGIGRKGTLPWPTLKGEMGYFARVTKRLSPSVDPSQAPQKRNAVIMGRKTWDSIPTKFRPLKGRANVVISRSLKIEEQEAKGEGSVEIVSSLQEAVDLLEARDEVDRVFVIGGSSIYDAALKHPATIRVLLTQIETPEFECDTFFPVDVEKERDWTRGTSEELQEWTGEDFGEKSIRRTEGDVSYEFCLFEKR